MNALPESLIDFFMALLAAFISGILGLGLSGRCIAGGNKKQQECENDHEHSG